MENENVVFQNQQAAVTQASEKSQPYAQVENISNKQGILNPPEKKKGGLKKMLSLLLSVFVILGLFVVIAAIFYPSSRGPLGGSVTLTYWGIVEDPQVMQKIIADFEKQNPTIKIKYEKQDIVQYRDRLTTRIANKTGPDIFSFHNTWYPMLKSNLSPLPAKTISPEEFRAIFYGVARKDLIRGGAIYGVPLHIDTLSLFINTKLFQSAGLAPPTNWVDFVNAARVMTVKDEGGKILTSGAAMGTFSNVTHAPDILSMLFLQNGVDFNDLNASSQRISDALTFYASFVKDSNTWNDTLDPSQLAFSKGNLGMYFGYSSDYFAIKKFDANLEFQVVPVPQLPEQNMTFASYWAEGVSVKSKYQKEAFIFLKFLAKKETEQKLFAEESRVQGIGYPNARVDLADNLDKNSPVYTFVLQAPNASSSYFVGGTYDNGLSQELNKELEKIMGDFLRPGKRNFDIKTFINNVLSIFQKYDLSAGSPIQ